MTSEADHTATVPAVRDAAVRAARRLWPAFSPGELLHVTGKSVLLAGTCGRQPVVAKLLLDRAPFWRAMFTREVHVYRAFTTSPPPVRAPRLVAADAETGVLITERLSGRPLHADRYPRGPLAVGDLSAVLDAVDALTRWGPPAPLRGEGRDAADRLDRYHHDGLLDAAVHRALAALLAEAGPERRFAHGDVLPANIWLTGDPGAPVSFLDWEFAGLFLPGRDLALLWVLLRNVPGARDLVVGRVGADPVARAAFTVNRGMLLARERRIHREAAPGAWRDTRLAALEADWDAFRATVLYEPTVLREARRASRPARGPKGSGGGLP
ncbi:hypothetical protein ACWENQ_20050 [Nonomuraea sp. NPDC004354]